MSERREEIAASKSDKSFLKRAIPYAIVLIGVFLLGFVPMWLTARARAAERDAAQRSLHLSQAQNRVATAIVESRRGNYEPARLAASEFFTDLRTELDRTGDYALNAAQRSRIELLLAQRDEIITLLARNDPAAFDRLMDLYVAYRDATTPGASG